MFDAEFTRKVGGPAWKSMDIEDDNLVSSEEKPCEERARKTNDICEHGGKFK